MDEKFDFNKKTRNLVNFFAYCQKNTNDKKCKVIVRFFSSFLEWCNISHEGDVVSQEFKDIIERRCTLKVIFNNIDEDDKPFDYNEEVKNIFAYFEKHSQNDTMDNVYFKGYVNFIQNILEFFTGDSAEEIEARRKIDNNENVEYWLI